MAISRDKDKNRRLTQKLMLTNEAIERTDPSWLGNGGKGGILDYELLKGATFDELIERSGRKPNSIRAHFQHLKNVQGLEVIHDNGIYRLGIPDLNNEANPANSLFSEVTLDHIILAVEDFKTKGAPTGLGPSKYYDVKIGDTLYPPKPIMAYANYYATGREPGNYFSGGENTPCFKAFERLGIEIIPKTNETMLNQDLFESHFLDYSDYCKRSVWLYYREAYKFRFSRWLAERIDFDRMSDEEILEVCVASQEVSFDEGEKGINFIKSGLQYNDAFITLNDIKVLRKLYQGGLLGAEDLKDSPLSFPKFSVWAGTLVPENYRVYANEELTGGLAYLFDLKNYPKSGLKAFELATAHLLILSQAMVNQFGQILEELLVLVFPENKSMQACDLPWLTQDFILYLNRRILKKSINYFWVNQGGEYKNELEHGCIAATNTNLHHHKRLKAMFEGDVVINYANSAIRATSLVTQEFQIKKRPYLKEGEEDLVVGLDYQVLDEPIEIDKLKSLFEAHKQLLPKKYGPFDKYFNVVQSYCLDFNQESYHLIFDNSMADTKLYWLYSPGENAKYWEEFYSEGIMGIGWDELGDLNQFTDRDQIRKALDDAYGGEGDKKNDVSANDDFINKMNVGDTVIVKRGRTELLGYGVVTSDYYFDENRADFKSCRKVDWKTKGSWTVNNSMIVKTLTDITPFKAENLDYDKYYEELLGIMNGDTKSKKNKSMKFPLNTILYGPPGTGKTYRTLLKAAEIITMRPIENYEEAKSIFNEHLGNQIEFITFHQNYSYEDFIQGLRPDVDNNTSLTFDRKDGIFKTIADRALENLILSEKAPEEVSREALFDEALVKFSEEILDSEENFPINDTAYIFEVENDAYRYTGEKWTNHVNGLRMKFNDLREFFRNDVKTRKDVKKLKSISGLANQHATYYFLVYQKIIDLLPEKLETPTSVEKKNYVIIIDEINRANISRVFGELITLIEPDKRSHGAIPLKCTLPSGEEFVVPSNLYIIGTMNTADKSIALLDIALRRRFVFEPMYPQYDIANELIYDVEVLKKINKKIIELKGHDFQIGHAYFMNDNHDLLQRFNTKVIPLLLEYFMNDEKEVKTILSNAGLEIDGENWPLKIKGLRDQSL